MLLCCAIHYVRLKPIKVASVLCGRVCHSDAVRVQGPREDSGSGSRVNPGIALVERIYSYVERFFPNSAIMATGIRHKSGAPPFLLLLSLNHHEAIS